MHERHANPRTCDPQQLPCVGDARQQNSLDLFAIDGEKDSIREAPQGNSIDLGTQALQDDRSSPDPVVWAPNNPERPINWKNQAKCLNLGLICFFRFLTPLASSIIAPAAYLLLEDLGSDSETIGSFVVSIYVLGYALGPLVLSPLSELYGRLPVYHISNILFTIWNMATALSPNIGAVLAFRLLAGLAGSCPVALGNGSIADCVTRENRGKVSTIFAAGPLMGPVLGPIAGGYLGENAGWRWVFWTITIASGVSTLVSLMVQSETYEPVLLARRAKRLHKTMGGPRPSQHDSPADSKRAILGRTIARPIKLLITSPIVLITSIYVGLVYGYTYLLFTSFPILFQDIYGFSQSQVGLAYLGFGIGSIIGLAVFGAISDRSAAARSLAGGEWKPEYRLPPLLPASLIIPTGLFWYGWSAQTRVHWIVPVLGSGWVGLGTVAVLLPVQTYLIDAFELYAASASAANTVLRSLIGAFLPLAGPSLYSALGQGWGNSILGFIALAFTPMVWIILKYGERIRKAYPVNV